MKVVLSLCPWQLHGAFWQPILRIMQERVGGLCGDGWFCKWVYMEQKHIAATIVRNAEGIEWKTRMAQEHARHFCSPCTMQKNAWFVGGVGMCDWMEHRKWPCRKAIPYLHILGALTSKRVHVSGA